MNWDGDKMMPSFASYCGVAAAIDRTEYSRKASEVQLYKRMLWVAEPPRVEERSCEGGWRLTYC